MPWVSEWVKVNGQWVNKNYYVKPASGEAVGEDYRRKVTIQTYTDASTGETVKIAQASDTVSTEEGKVIAKAVQTKEAYEEQGLKNIKISQVKKDDKVVGLEVSGEHPEKVISRGAWSSKTTAEKQAYLNKNPNTKVLTPTGKVEPVITKDGQTIVNPETIIPKKTPQVNQTTPELQSDYDRARDYYLNGQPLSAQFVTAGQLKPTPINISKPVKEVFETEESYNNRLNNYYRLININKAVNEAYNTKQSINPNAGYTVEVNGQGMSISGSELINLYNKNISNLSANAQIIKQSSNVRRSFMGTVADIYRSDKGSKLGKLQEPLARAAEGFEVFETSGKWLTEGIIEVFNKPLSTGANIALGVGSMGAVPVYNIATQFGKAIGKNIGKPIIIDYGEDFGLLDTRQKQLLKEWQPLNPFNPDDMKQYPSSLRTIAKVGAVGGTVAGGYLIADTTVRTVKSIINDFNNGGIGREGAIKIKTKTKTKSKSKKKLTLDEYLSLKQRFNDLIKPAYEKYHKKLDKLVMEGKTKEAQELTSKWEIALNQAWNIFINNLNKPTITITNVEKVSLTESLITGSLTSQLSKTKTATITKKRIKPITKPIILTKTSNKLSSKLLSKTSILTKPITTSRTQILTRPRTRTLTLTSTLTQPLTLTDIITKTGTTTTTKTTTQTLTDTLTSTQALTRPRTRSKKIPVFKWDKGSTIIANKLRKFLKPFKGKYAPSLTARVLNIRGKQPKRISGKYTGLELRPLTTKKNKKKGASDYFKKLKRLLW